MIQLVVPNLLVSGRIGYCLEYVARVFQNPAPGTTAWNAWRATQEPRVDALPQDVCVPVWFSYWATIDGIYANYGHVVISVPGVGFYSSPWAKGTDHAVLASIAEVERVYHAAYVGWSEDILGLQVVKQQEVDVVDINIARILSASILGNNGQNGTKDALNGEVDKDLQKYIGMSTDDLIHQFYDSDQGKNYTAYVRTPQVAPGYEQVTETLFRKKA